MKHAKALGLAVCFALVMQAQGESAGATVKPDLVAIMESTSFVDRGIKGIVFPDGHGWLLKSKGESPPDAYPVWLSPAAVTSVSSALDRNYYFELPASIRSLVTDGADVDVYVCGGGRCKIVQSYCSENTAFNDVVKAIREALERQASTVKPVPFANFISDSKSTITKLPKGSAQAVCAEKFFERLFFQYFANGSSSQTLKDQLASLLTESVAQIRAKQQADSEKEYFRSEASKKRGPEALSSIQGVKALLHSANQFATIGALKGGRDKTADKTLLQLSQWWSRAAALNAKLDESDWLNDVRGKVTAETLRLYTAHQFLLYAMHWTQRGVLHSMKGEHSKAVLCDRAAEMSVTAASDVITGSLPASMTLGALHTGTCLADCTGIFHYEARDKAIIALKNKRDPDGLEPSFSFLIAPKFLPEEDRELR